MGATASIVIHKPGPNPLPPPALRQPVASPALPNLPPIASYPKPTPPGKMSADEVGCGQVWSGSEWMPVECIDPTAHGHAAREAVVIVPYAQMKEPIEHLPKLVDHRADGSEGPIRKQTGPECTAFALTAAFDHAYARWAGTPGHFSVMQVWARYDLLQEHAAADNNVGDYLANESDWPYDGAEATSWIACPKNKAATKPCGQPIDKAKLASLDGHPMAEITQIEALPTSELDVLREKLAAGQDVAIAVRLPSFALAGSPGAKYVVGVDPKDPAKKGTSGHEVLLAGYAMLPSGNYYLVHNSWGTGWGDRGYAWIHEDILKAFWNDKMMIVPDVQPVEVAKLREKASGGLTAPCPGKELPDSISGLCAGACPDGGPRHNDVCATTGQCPEGQINLTGECEMAAPAKASGTDPTSKVRWACATSGCTYWLPQGQQGCTQNECSVSCPAPEFRLASTPKGLVCLE
jgi:hypothetical protein